MTGRFKGVLVAVAALTVLALIVYGNMWRTRAASGTEVMVEAASPATIESSSFSTGEVEAAGMVEARASMAGILESVAVQAGDMVQEGSVLARYRLQDLIDRKVSMESALASARANLTALSTRARQGSEEAQINLAMAEIALTVAKEAFDDAHRWPPWDDQFIDAKRAWERAQADYEMARINAERVTVSPEEMEAARASYRAAEVQAEQAREDLEKADMLSPINGVVLAVHAGDGQQVTAGQLLAELSDPLMVKVKAKVDELDIASVSVGQAARVTTQAYPGREFKGQVSWISPTAQRDGNVANFIVEVDIENPEGLLKPGMSVDVDLIHARVEAHVTVPLEAVRDIAGKKVVFVIEEGVAKEREVEVGAANGTRTEIASGLKAGESVVVGPQGTLRTLKDGARVWAPEGDKE
ncbi:MAG: efflux RND transporter periplasmic adaptor subunit [Bacillota bacterium]